MSPPTAVLLMAYGTAPSQDERDIRAYLRHILQFYRKTDPTDVEVRHLAQRLEAAGGSPLYEITERIAQRLASKLGNAFVVRTAMKHSPPFIEETVASLASEGFDSGIGVALAPFRSRLSTEGYYRLVEEANAAQSAPLPWNFVEDWNRDPSFLELWRQLIADQLEDMPAETLVIFTNHSLPARIAEWSDPYPAEFAATANAIAEGLSLTRCTTAYQSAGGGNQPWLGPDVLEVIEREATTGCRNILAAPIGFVMDHLEVTYDLDIVARDAAQKLGVRLERTRMPNHDPLFVSVLADAVTGSREPGAESR